MALTCARVCDSLCTWLPQVTSADLEFFADLWSSMPREGVLRRDAQYLHVKHFKMLLFRLGIPLGFDPVLCVACPHLVHPHPW